MFEQLELSASIKNTLAHIYTGVKKHDPYLSEDRFLETIIYQWLRLYHEDQAPLHKDSVALRNNLKNAIKSSGKTQRQIADETGISYAYLSQVIHGKYEPGIMVVLLLMRALNCTPAQLNDLFYLEPVP